METITGLRLLGLRTVVYPAPDVDAARRWWTAVLGFEPYFDEPYYVGYDVGGFELSLDPDGDPADGPVVYWGVEDVGSAERALLDAGGSAHRAVTEVGGGIRVAVVRNPHGVLVGVIHNPHFRLPART